jgi:hypothetical protein
VKKTAKPSKTIWANKRKAKLKAKHRRQRARATAWPTLSPRFHCDRLARSSGPMMDADIFQRGVDLAPARHQLLEVAPIHADVVQRAIDAECREVAARLAEERGEFSPAHLTRGHWEGAMVDRPEAARVTVD